MTDDGRTLVATQRRLRRLIAAPSGVAAALAEDGTEAAALAALVRDDRGLGAVERLDVYANAYFYRIHDCLAEDFGALRAALGPDWFHDLITAYLLDHPPRHPSLRFAGDRLAGHLRDAAGAQPFRDRLPWAADLAALEWALVDAFDAADAPAVGREALAAVPPDRWSALRFELQPALAQLCTKWPVHALRRAWDREEPLAASLEPSESSLRVWRSGERVRYQSIDASEAQALERIARGENFGALCTWLADATGETEAPARAAGLLARWIGDDLIARILR